jgi:SAM-dependent methyltransferase
MPSIRTPRETVVGRFDRTGRHWDDVYTGSGEGWIRRMWNRYGRANVRSRFVRTFEIVPDLSAQRILDVGCGSGRYLTEAVDRGAVEAVGIDISPEMIGVAREAVDGHPRAAAVKLRLGDVTSMELEGGFDLVVANGLFDYLEDPAASLTKAASCCRGVLIATFPHALAIRAFPRLLYWRMRGVRIHLFTRRGIVTMAGRAGLSRCRLERIGPILLLVGEREAV